jgi:acetoin utilization deacetylase AcuC-like enzyme
MAMLHVYTHPACLDHDPGPGHPESPARLKAVLGALRALPTNTFDEHHAQLVERALVERVHEAALVQRLYALAPAQGYAAIDADTRMSPGSLEAARRAAGAVVQAVDAVLDGLCRRAFCAVRPPGHHATRAEAMGFCLFNNIAVGTQRALARGLKRVAVVDFDVHHGNGTQDIFWDEPRVLFCSTHQAPLYPGTGAESERGGRGRVRNLPLHAGADSLAFRAAWRELLREIDGFQPQLILVSAGFDAHRLDPLAGLNLGAMDFQWITAELVALAERHAGGRLVSSLEGGYSLSALAECAVAHVEALRAG